MPYLNWIDDEILINAVINILKKANEAQHKAQKKFGKNVIDPFSALFEMAGFNMDFNDWHKSETARQAQKTLQNHIGEFHQTILGSCSNWVNKMTGNVIDLENNSTKIIAEIKNKYNTISGGQLSNLYYSLSDLVSPKSSKYKDYVAFYVTIIPKNPERFNKPFVPSDKTKGQRCATNEKIREIDGASFYEIVTGNYNALADLFDVLPKIIKNEYPNSMLAIDNLKTCFSTAFIK